MSLFGCIGNYGNALEGLSPWNDSLRQKYRQKLLAQRSHIRPSTNRCWWWETCSGKRSYANKPNFGPQMGHFTSLGLCFLIYKIRGLEEMTSWDPDINSLNLNKHPAILWSQLHDSYLAKPLEGTRRLGDFGLGAWGGGHGVLDSPGSCCWLEVLNMVFFWNFPDHCSIGQHLKWV